MERFWSTIYLSIILLSIIAITPQPSIVEGTGDSITYVLQNIWSTDIEDINATGAVVYRDFDGDGINDILVFSQDNETTSICSLDGLIGTLYGCTTIVDNITGLIAVDDVDGNGYKDLVITTYRVDPDTNNTNVTYIVWDPITNSIVRSNYVVIDKRLSWSGFIPIMNAVYEDGKVKNSLTYMEFTGFTFTMGTYIISYDPISNQISYTVIDNVMYILFASEVYGDIDNDGVLEFADGYKVITSMSLSGFTLSFGLSVYRNGTQLFTETYTDRIPVLVGVTYTGVEERIWSYEIGFSLYTPTGTFYIVEYSLDGSKEVEITLSDVIPYGFLDLGEYQFVIYEDNTTGEIYADLYSMVDGSRIFHVNVTMDEPVTGAMVGLGDVDSDGFKEIMYAGMNRSYVLKAKSDTEKYGVEGEPPDMNYYMFSVVETSTMNYLVVTVPYENGTRVEAYAVSTKQVGVVDNTPPVIIPEYPLNGTFVGQILIISAIVYDNESGVMDVEAYLYHNETGYNESVSLATTYIAPNTYRVFGFMFMSDSGDYVLTITAWNYANLSTTINIYFRVDVEPPELEVYGPVDDGIYNIYDLPLTLNFTVWDENLDNWTVYLNGDVLLTGNTTGNFTYELTNDTLKPGFNSIYIEVYDKAGNLAIEYIKFQYYPGPFKFNFTILNIGYYDFITENTTIYYRLEGYSEPEILYLRFNLDSHVYEVEPIFNTTQSIVLNVTMLDEDLYNLTVVISVKGYGEYTIYTLLVRVDPLPPRMNVSLPLVDSNILDIGNATIVDDRVEFTMWVEVEDEYPDRVEIYVNDQLIYNDTLWFIYSEEPYDITLSEGVNTIVVKAYDIVGHVTIIKQEVVVDLTPPTIEEFIVNVTDSNMTIEYRVSDNLSGIDRVVLTINGTEHVYNETEKVILFTNMTIGNYTITIKAYDRAGLSTTETKNVSIQPITPPPTTPTTTPTVTPTSPKTTPTSPTLTSPSLTKTSPVEGIPGTLIAGIVIAVIVIALIVFWIMKK